MTESKDSVAEENENNVGEGRPIGDLSELRTRIDAIDVSKKALLKNNDKNDINASTKKMEISADTSRKPMRKGGRKQV